MKAYSRALQGKVNLPCPPCPARAGQGQVKQDAGQGRARLKKTYRAGYRTRVS